MQKQCACDNRPLCDVQLFGSSAFQRDPKTEITNIGDGKYVTERQRLVGLVAVTRRYTPPLTLGSGNGEGKRKKKDNEKDVRLWSPQRPNNKDTCEREGQLSPRMKGKEGEKADERASLAYRWPVVTECLRPYR